jgi:hypothetical protein
MNSPPVADAGSVPAHAPSPGSPPVARRGWGPRLLLLLSRVVLIGVGANLLVQVPLPVLDDWLPVKHVAIAVGVVVLIGKALFDTLFFDHYVP